MDILNQFGIEAKLLVVQLINFVILALVFWKFILPRLTSLMNERQTQIRDSLAAAEQAQAEVAQAQAARDAELERAKQEADRVIAEAAGQAQAEAAAVITQAKEEAARIRRQQSDQLKADKETLRAELRAEVADVAVATTRKVLRDVITKADSAKMVAAAERKLKSQAKRRTRGRK